MSAYEELRGHHLRSTLDLVTFTPASEYLDSTETPDVELSATAFHRHNLRDARPHMHPLYYYFGTPDSDSADDTYDPTRKCFNIDGAIASDSEDEAAIGGRNAMPPQVEPLLHEMKLNSLRTKECNSSKSMNYRTGLMRNKKICAYFNKPSSMSARHAHTTEELEKELTTSIVASSRIEWVNPWSSAEPARMLS
jgi:hypothetical protein